MIVIERCIKVMVLQLLLLLGAMYAEADELAVILTATSEVIVTGQAVLKPLALGLLASNFAFAMAFGGRRFTNHHEAEVNRLLRQRFSLVCVGDIALSRDAGAEVGGIPRTHAVGDGQ